MTSRPKILAAAQAQFPKSANKGVRLTAAWRREDATTDWPAANGMDGWTSVSDWATYDAVTKLRDRGFTWVSLETGGTSWPAKNVRIDALI